MKINRRSLLVRWAFLWDAAGVPQTTSLCAFFWRCVLGSPAKVAVTTALIILFGPFFLIYMGWKDYVRPYLPQRDLHEKVPFAETFLGNLFYGIKHRVCPLIELE